MSGRAVAAVALSAAVAATFVSPLLVSPARARITEIRIGTIEPFAESQPFGEAGSYERVTGTAKGELDPQSAQNHDIVDLDKAPRNARGLVEYETDFFMLRPIDPARGNGVLFYEVNNRGRKALLTRIDEAPADNNDPRTILDAGLGFTLGRGYTVVWSGWDPDAPRANNGLTARLPVATDDGKPIVRRIREEFEFGTRNNANGELAKLSYPAANLDNTAARLTMREREGDPRVDIPPHAWSFANNRALHLVPAGRRFAPLAIYELWYDATAPKVVGMGFAATRDFVSFLRYERVDTKGTVNPAMASDGDSGRAPPRADVRHFPERPLRAQLHRARHEQGRERPARVRRRVRAHRGRRQGVRQRGLRRAPAHRHPARGPPLPRELVPVLDRDRDRSRERADRRAVPRRRQRSPADLDQHLDRILAEGRVAHPHRCRRQGGPRPAAELARLPHRRHPAWRRGGLAVDRPAPAPIRETRTTRRRCCAR